jgi:hypothetical protein
MKPNFSKIRIVSFTRKTNVLNYQYRLGNSVILRTDCVKDLGVHIDCKPHFHRHVDFLFITCNGITTVNSYTYISIFYHRETCCILLWSDPNWSILLLLGTLLQLLTPVNLSAFKKSKGHSSNRDATYNVELRQLSLFHGTVSHRLRH